MYTSGAVFSYKLRYIVGFWLVEMAISTNQKPTIYRNLYENTGPEHAFDSICKSNILPQISSDHSPVLWSYISSPGESRDLWELNICFLMEREYIYLINTNVNKWVEEATTLDDTRMQWDYIKI